MKQYTLFLGAILFLLLTFYNVVAQTTNHWETILKSDTTYTYFTSSEGTTATNWRTPEFNDSNWRTGKGGIGYADGDDNTIIENSISVCLRISFNLIDKNTITEAVLNMDYDDAFVAYLNGVEIARSTGLSGNFPESTQTSTSSHEAKMYDGGLPESFCISLNKLSPIIKEGTNILAVQVHNTDVNSSDMSSNIFLMVGVSDSQTRYFSNPEWFKTPFDFSGSTLPLIIIDTHGETIVDEPKITADMKIIHNEDGNKNSLTDYPNEYNGKIGIERRGATSYYYPQKPYLFETRNEDGSNNNVEILGMPEENDWILLSHYNDKTFMRNAISFDLFREMGNYSVRSRLCDVVINGEYEGIYLLCEKIKRDKNRVDISKIKSDDTQDDDLTGGYIFKVDYYYYSEGWISNYGPTDHPSYKTRFIYYYPDHNDIVSSQRQYLKTHVDKFQYVLNHSDFENSYSSFINDSSFIDYFIVNELARNVDGYKKSRYFYKNRDSKGGLIKAGPVWDFDWAWKNINDCYIFRQTDGAGWAYKINDCYETSCPGWYVRLLQDPVFADKLNCRYFKLRETILSDESLESKIDSIYNLVSEPQVGHFERWDILGKRTGAPEVEEPAQTYNEEVSRLRNWISLRLNWLDNNMVGNGDNCFTSTYEIAQSNPVTMYPNPASAIVNFESNIEILQIEIFDYSGRVVVQKTSQFSRTVQIDLNNLKPGLYLTKSTFVNGNSQTNKLVIK